MIERVVVRRNTYFDSVALMRLSGDVRGRNGVLDAAAVQATPLNVDLIAAQGYALPDGLSPNDLVIAVRAETEEAADGAVQTVEWTLAERGRSGEAVAASEVPPRSAASAARRDPRLSLALVSVPARHAAYEVALALEAGLHVFCFSDGVPLEHEVAMKRRALELGLLLMGPDCGTAIVDGVGLGFANVVERGPVGIVGASGTGTQELCCLLDAAGVGVSHAIGVGGRDLSAHVGGLMTVRALELLASDQATERIVVVSKPPAPTVAARVAEAAGRTGKPCVLAFVGMEEPPAVPDDVVFAETLEEAARAAAAGSDVPALGPAEPPAETPGLIRGLFCGGTLCDEAMAVVSGTVGEVRSNIPLRAEWRLAALSRSEGHTFIDFGDDELTKGRAHPMIDPSLRNERLLREAADAEVGVVVLDVVLGRGVHPDPAAGLAPLVEKALAERGGRLTVVVYLCGSRGDPQDPERQARALAEAGAVVTRSAAYAARLALMAAGLEPLYG